MNKEVNPCLESCRFKPNYVDAFYSLVGVTVKKNGSIRQVWQAITRLFYALPGEQKADKIKELEASIPRPEAIGIPLWC